MLTNDDTDPRSVQQRLDVTNRTLRSLYIQTWIVSWLLLAIAIKLWI